MNLSAERMKIVEEIEQIPENKLAELYRMVHKYRLEQEETDSETRTPSKLVMQYAGAWEGMSDQDVEDFLQEIRTRRKEAFSSRRDP